ncbi:hypothetical protein [Streptomyces agglomeratus]|uniref:hypothetical protein n=1 Tax=Streptomyces agglomeratus TaxID=285458 RepID=UPI00114CC82B|nr:hypothetical protein [Streptomyces agglomeratus]
MEEELDVQSIKDLLQRFAGKRRVFAAAQTCEEFSALSKLPQVEREISNPRPGQPLDLDECRIAVEGAIRSAAKQLEDTTYAILDGRVHRKAVPVDRMWEAITLTFNLEHREGLGTAAERRDRAKRALGLECSARANRDTPGPEQDVLRVLASQLVSVATQVDEVRTEKIEFTVTLTPREYDPVYQSWDPTGLVAVSRVDIVRTVKAAVSGANRLLDGSDVMHTCPGCGEFRSRFGCEVRIIGPWSNRKVIVHFPETALGASRKFGYGISVSSDLFASGGNLVWINPQESYGALSLRVVLPQNLPAAEVFASTGQRYIPHWSDYKEMSTVAQAGRRLLLAGLRQPRTRSYSRIFVPFRRPRSLWGVDERFP